jgi:hypothetical protein
LPSVLPTDVAALTALMHIGFDNFGVCCYLQYYQLGNVVENEIFIIFIVSIHYITVGCPAAEMLLPLPCC